MCFSALFVSSCTLVCKQCVINANIFKAHGMEASCNFGKSRYFMAPKDYFYLHLGTWARKRHIGT